MEIIRRVKNWSGSGRMSVDEKRIIFCLRDTTTGRKWCWDIDGMDSNPISERIQALEYKYGVLDFEGRLLPNGIWETGFMSYEVRDWRHLIQDAIKLFKDAGFNPKQVES
jgi:hypothetical protein